MGYATMGMDSAARGSPWLGLVPFSGCAAFSASTVAIYLRDLGSQAWCATNVVCQGFEADPNALAAGVGFAILALALLLATVLAARHPPRPTRYPSPLALLVSIGVAASFAGLFAILSVSETGPAWLRVDAAVIWAFLAVGYAVLWIVLASPSSLEGAWKIPARGLGLVHGAVTVAATLVTVWVALTPRLFL